MPFDTFTGRTPKGYFTGTQRTRTPEETLEAYRRFMPMMGITRLANITGLDRIALPVCLAVRPNSRTLSTSQGKGNTLAAAKVSALMESIEGWHAERIDAPLLYDTATALAQRVRVADVGALALRADATFCPDRPIYWIEARDLMDDAPTWVPFETVAVNFVKQPGHTPQFLESTNGLASGNHPVEAVVHAVCEVIERDASTLWEAVPSAQRKARQLDLSTVTDPALRRVIDTLEEKGVAVAAWDITSDIGVPTFTCACVEDPDSDHWRPVGVASGHGTHLVPEIALSRALHEAIQCRLTTISGSRDDMFPADYLKYGDRAYHARVIADLRMPPPSLPYQPLRPPVGDCFEDDLETLLALLRRAGLLSALAVDLSRSEVGIPVVKVVVPGLEPFHTPLYQPGARARRLSLEVMV
jgi:YcaO-like protein with predicted kinase domain